MIGNLKLAKLKDAFVALKEEVEALKARTNEEIELIRDMKVLLHRILERKKL